MYMTYTAKGLARQCIFIFYCNNLMVIKPHHQHDSLILYGSLGCFSTWYNNRRDSFKIRSLGSVSSYPCSQLNVILSVVERVSL